MNTLAPLHENLEIIPAIVKIDGDPRPYLPVKIFDIVVRGLLDSGATCTIYGKGGLDFLKANNLVGNPTNVAVKTADGTLHTAVCSVDIPYCVKKKIKVVKTLIIPSMAKTLILGVDFWDAFGIQPKFSEFTIDCAIVDQENNKNAYERVKLSGVETALLEETIKDFMFSSPGSLSCTNLLAHHIDTGDAKPVVKRPHPISPYVQKEVDSELDRMLTMGVIEPANSEWANPLVVVRKSSGKVRLCLDARGLNGVTKKDPYPLPHIGRILAQIRTSKYLSSVDLSDAFWQVPLDEHSKPKTSFIVPGRGHYQFNRLPFGLCNSAQTLCKAIDKCIGNDLEPNVYPYIDDILITSNTFEEHRKLLAEVARRLKNSGFSISAEKSKFCAKRLTYLGLILDESGLRMDPERINPILNMPPPRNLKELRSIIGMAGWYRRFLKNFSALTAPMTDLLKVPKNKNDKSKRISKFVWTKEANDAFLELKSALVSSPVLCSPNYDEKFSIQTDASELGIGAVLTQGEGENEKVISYMSMKLSAQQKKYSATERECLAVLEAIKKFRNYVEGVRFIVITDHASLIWLKNLKDPTSRLSRWALQLQAYDFELIHRKGKLNVVADALSRFIEVVDSNHDGKTVDEKYENLIKKIVESPVKFPSFRIIQNRIYKHCYTKDELGNFEYNWKDYPPFHERKHILQKYHDSPIGAHLGVQKTLKKIQERYFWPRMREFVIRYVKSCELCQTNKHPNKVTKVPMGAQKIVNSPWDTIAIDFLGHFPLTKLRNRFILVVVDVFSKFCLLKPVPNADSKSTIKFLENDVFLLFGVPKKIIADNGSAFISKEFKKFCDQYQVSIDYNAAYHPQHNPAERINRVVLSSIRSYLDSDHRDWDLYVPKIACALRTAEHESTGFTPYKINFGKSMETDGKRLPLVVNDDNNNVVEDKIIKLNNIREKVQLNLKNAYQKYSRNYNLRTKPIEFLPGEIVLRKNFALSNAGARFNAKLAPQYIKFRIREKLGASTYLLEDLIGKVVGKFHANDLRKFVARE